MRSVRVWVAALGLGVALAEAARAQPQDDAALADAPKEKAPVYGSPASPWPSAPASQATEEEQEAELEPVITTEQLRRTYPDLQVRVTPPPTLTVLSMGLYPFQPVGLGLGFDIYALPRLRLSALSSFGGTLGVNRKWHFSLYGEVGVGIVLARWPGQTIAELPVFAARNFRSSRSAFHRFMLGDEPPPDGPLVRALVPSSHSLELEGGAFTGFYPRYRCTAHCDEDPALVEHTKQDASLQVTLLYAGVRYVYYRWARSEQAPFRSLAGFEAAVDALTNPFTPHDPGVFNLYDHHPTYNPVGVRVKLRIPAIKCKLNGPCLGLDLMGGYLPSPADATFSASLLVQ